MIQHLIASSQLITNTGSRYVTVDGSANDQSVLTDSDMVVAEAGVFSNSYARLSVAPGAGNSWAITLMKNGVAQTHAIAIAESATTGTDVTNPITVAAGDKLAWRFVGTSAPTSADVTIIANYTPTTAQRAIWGSGCTAGASNSATSYAPIGGGGNVSNVFTTVENAATVPWAINATITSLHIKKASAPGAGKNWVFSIMKNGLEEVSSQVTLADAATLASITGLSIVIAPGDTLSMKAVPTGTPSVDDTAWGISYTPTTDGQWNISGIQTANMTTNAFQWVNVGGGDTDESIEAERTSTANGPLGSKLRARGMRYRLTVAPGAGDTRTLTLYKNGAPTGLAATIANTDTTGSDTDNVQFDSLDTWSLQHTVTGTIAASACSWSMLVETFGGAGGGEGGRPPRGKPPKGGGGGGLASGPVLKKLRFPDRVI